jgi:hypothetical protein
MSVLLRSGVGEAYPLARTAAVDHVKKKSPAARPKARPGFAAPLGFASRALPLPE